MDGVRVDERVRHAAGARPEVGVLNLLHVIPSFAEGWNSVGAVDCAFSRVIRRQCQIEVAIVAFQKRPQIFNTGVDILISGITAGTIAYGAHWWRERA